LYVKGLNADPSGDAGHCYEIAAILRTATEQVRTEKAGSAGIVRYRNMSASTPAGCEWRDDCRARATRGRAGLPP